ncbi:putative polysaccharide biosynthesis protein [Alicyclobacillus fastidiosus]|uniref:Polysaccharide biosynthesis protein n=1 Tax=Alicyclobacillus fastidiosus TaxID=392011 RepID=A0ABV5ACE7_9BACL|nr:polysaccharide biosynthesis protein [Alicyclobacillus fastidiosus]WEH11364.1 polysaccharide biosynthesis protein [Alicyclobacillus fastidiosus]
MQKAGLVRGSSIMVAAIGITKFLGIISIVPINQLLGNVGQGYYSTAYNLYTILMVLATSGLPTALSKLISERASTNRFGEIEQLYRITLKLVCSFAVIGALLVWFGAPYYASLVGLHANHSEIADMTLSIRALAPAILVVPLESALRGYLQGFQEVKGPALSQAIEQLFRVVVAVFGTLIVVKIGMGVAKGAAAATFGAFVGAVAGVLVLWLAIFPLRRHNKRLLTYKADRSDKEIRRLLYRVALPVCLGSLVVPISSNIDSLTVVNFLTHFAGQSFSQAQAGFGILSRQAQNLVQLPLAFTMAVGFSVMPAISEAMSLKDGSVIQLNIITPFRMMFFVTFPAAAVFLSLGKPIEYILSNSFDGSKVIATISFMCIFSSMELMSTYILQGLGNFYRPVRNMFLGIALKAILNVLLIILLKSVLGAAIATILGYVLSSTLNILAVKRYSGVQFSVIRLALPFLLASLPLLIELVLVNHLLSFIGSSFSHSWLWIWNVFQLSIACVTGGALYLFITLRMRLIRPQQIRSLPIVGQWLSRLTEKTIG